MSTHQNFDLKTFTFNGHTLRTVVIDGKLWFPASDLPPILGMSRQFPHDARRGLNPDEWRVVDRNGAGKELPYLFGGPASRFTLFSESGLYKIILRAQRTNPAAREFQDWLTKEVLPRIRPTVTITQQSAPLSVFPQMQSPRGDHPLAVQIPPVGLFPGNLLTHERTSPVQHPMTTMQEVIDTAARATVENTPRSQRHRIAHIDAADALMKAAVFYVEAAQRIAEGAPADCPEVARLVDFGGRKARQGKQLLA